MKLLFIKVPFQKTVDVMLERIYYQKEINTAIARSAMRKVLLLCTGNVHFTFDDCVYLQNDGIVMRSPLGPVLFGIIIVELIVKVVPVIINYSLNQKLFADNKVGYVKTNEVDYVLENSNNFHKSIQFTYELEKGNNIIRYFTNQNWKQY